MFGPPGDQIVIEDPQELQTVLALHREQTEQMAAGKKFPRAYMATGVEDAHYEDNRFFMDKYASQGLDIYRVIDHGYHNWEYCDKHVKLFLDWLASEGKIKNTFVRASE